MRALAWDERILYASQAYTLLGRDMTNNDAAWQLVGYYRPAWWRNLSATARLSFRFFRDGFHALAVPAPGYFVAAVPGAIIKLAPGDTEFQVSHSVKRGTRPLHIAATPDKRLYWGEYFDNPSRDEVHIYGSEDLGLTWGIVHTFPKGAIRHVHNIVYDEFEKCLWILTGDVGSECQILRAESGFRHVEIVLKGNQQARAAALVPACDAVYFASDTPLEANYVYRLGRDGSLASLGSLSSSSIYGCRVNNRTFFSTMVEPSAVNLGREVSIYGSSDGRAWTCTLRWKKDRWPMNFFQYGNALLPDGKNTSGHLAVTTVAVENSDLETSIWRF
jgi:hypothetical protein